MNQQATSQEQESITPSMSQTTQLGVGILAAAIVLGLLGDGLLRATPWGINLFLCIGTLVLVTFGLLEWQQLTVKREARWLVIPVLFFAGALAWRSSGTLAFFNVMALLVTLALAAHYIRHGELRFAGMADMLILMFMAGIHATFGALILLLGRIEWRSLPRTGWSGQLLAVGRGLILTVPLLVIFGGLFMAADAVFEGLITELLDIDLDELITHLFLFGFWAWLTAGYLTQLLLSQGGNSVPAIERPAFAKLGGIEVGIILGALNLLFLAFVMVQFRYFFGGAELVEVTTTLTYAEYARRGFFELVTVATLLLPLLLFMHWLFRSEEAKTRRLFRFLAGALIALLYIIMLSAIQRMRLYQHEFGLTELRLYTTVFMGWLAIVFGWFMLTVLREERERFVFGALVSGMLVLGGLQVLNPDAFIVQNNVGRQNAPNPFDRGYVTSLSADAVPTLIESLDRMSERDRCQAAADILQNWTPPDETDWRTWNWGRYQAWQTVEGELGNLQTMACP